MSVDKHSELDRVRSIGAEPSNSPSQSLALSPALIAELLDPAAWARVLKRYARITKLGLVMTDPNGRPIGICHNPQPVWSLAHNAKAAWPSECPFCLPSSRPCSAIRQASRTGKMVVAHDSAGLAHITAALSFHGQVLGVVLAGQVFDQYPDQLRIHRVARELRISATELWQVAYRQQPLSTPTFVAYGDLLMILAQAFLAQRYSAILDQEIADVNRRFRFLLEGVPDYGLFMMDPEGDVISWNSGAERVLGYSEQEILGRRGSILFTQEDIQEGVPEQELESATSGEKTAREGWSVRKDGSQFHGESVVTAVWENGVLQGFAKILHDVTERKLAHDQIANALREKEILLQELHHRVKNNLQVILSLLRLQANYSRDPEIVEILEESQGRVQAIANVHQMLSGTKNLARIDFSVYLRELAEKLFLSYGMQSERIQLVFDLEPALLGMDKAVSCGLIANELLSNIFKHAFPSDRSGKLAIGFKCAWPEGARLVVSDDGVGLPPEQDFRQPKTLGLELVSLLVEQLSGKIELDSSHGVRFEITFPVTADRTRHKNP